MFLNIMRGLPRLVAVAMLIAAATAACGKNRRPVKFEQVYAGANAPKDQFGPQFFSDAIVLDNSWIKRSLDQASYQQLRSKINFDRQVLLAFPTGEHTSFSGDIKFTDVYQYIGKGATMNALVMVGSLGAACRTDTVSFPFALAIIDKPEDFRPLAGHDMGTFDAGCPARAGKK